MDWKDGWKWIGHQWEKWFKVIIIRDHVYKGIKLPPKFPFVLLNNNGLQEWPKIIRTLMSKTLFFLEIKNQRSHEKISPKISSLYYQSFMNSHNDWKWIGDQWKKSIKVIVIRDHVFKGKKSPQCSPLYY